MPGSVLSDLSRFAPLIVTKDPRDRPAIISILQVRVL